MAGVSAKSRFFRLPLYETVSDAVFVVQNPLRRSAAVEFA
jgi:hypothetical protein